MRAGPSLHAEVGGRRRGWRGLYALAAVIFVVAVAVAWRRLPGLEVRWGWVAVLAAALSVVPLLNALEYRLAGRLLGHRIGVLEALRVTVLGSAANLLPLPGSVAVRVAGLRRKGSTYGASLRSTSAVGVGWLGTAALVAAVGLVGSGRTWAGAAFAALGAGALALMLAFLGDGSRPVWTAASRIVALEGVFVLVSAARLYAALHALGTLASIPQAVTLAVAGALAAAAGVFPGGLGLGELITGALAPLVGLSMAQGVLASALDRVVGLGVLAVAAVAAARAGSPA